MCPMNVETTGHIDNNLIIDRFAKKWPHITYYILHGLPLYFPFKNSFRFILWEFSNGDQSALHLDCLVLFS